MSDIDTGEISKTVAKRVQEELDKKDLNNKIELIANAASIYPDVISSLTGLRQSVENLNKYIREIRESQDKHDTLSVDTTEDLNGVFNKVREITERIEELENKIVNKNNPNSIVEVFTEMSNQQTTDITSLISEQNKSMSDQNNPNSIISVLKKSLSIQSTVTWVMLTLISIFTILEKIGVFGH